MVYRLPLYAWVPLRLFWRLALNARQRLLTALRHQEPDRVPLDLGASQVTGIQSQVYVHLRQHLGLPALEPTICDVIQGLAFPDDDLVAHLGVDVRGLFPLNSHNWNIEEIPEGEYWIYHDEWGITHRRPYPDGLYYSIWKEPLSRPDLTADDIQNHAWPDFSALWRVDGLREQAEAYQAAGYAVSLKDPFAGIFEMAQRMVGMENLLMMMAVNAPLAGLLFDKLAELKLDFWEMALPKLIDVIDVITQADDYGSQASQIISPRMFRSQIKPRWQLIFDRIKQLAPDAYRFFHSCGNVRPLIPDFIELGVQILNPVHIKANGMEPTALKRDFGDQLTFWGGGVDTQDVLPYGTPQQVQDDVRRNIDALAPGGGYVFNTVHNIQADVPVENLVAMYAAFHEYGMYHD
jgi:uroporphyrinogen decarboxylase